MKVLKLTQRERDLLLILLTEFSNSIGEDYSSNPSKEDRRKSRKKELAETIIGKL
jgi:hypothetical protein